MGKGPEAERAWHIQRSEKFTGLQHLGRGGEPGKRSEQVPNPEGLVSISEVSSWTSFSQCLTFCFQARDSFLGPNLALDHLSDTKVSDSR